MSSLSIGKILEGGICVWGLPVIEMRARLCFGHGQAFSGHAFITLIMIEVDGLKAKPLLKQPR